MVVAGNSEQTIEGLADIGGSIPDECSDYLLDIDNDDPDIPSAETIDTNHRSCCDDEMMNACSTRESSPLTRIFRFRTKPRARNVKRGRAVSYEYLKSFSSEARKRVFGLSDTREESSLAVRKKRLHKPNSLRNRRRNIRGFDDVSDDVDVEIETQEGKTGRRKRHTSWTVPEVSRLVEGVSQLGVGKWTVIKRLFFPTSAHRSSVDLKDKWRNLLRASCNSTTAQAKGRRELVRSSASPTIPHHILCRVRELSAIHPYPRERMVKVKGPQTVSSASSTSCLSAFDSGLA